MTWEVRWTPPATVGLEAVPWRHAERIAAAVERFARTGEGEYFRLKDDQPLTVRLHVGTYVVRLHFEQKSHVLHVWYLYHWP